MSDVVAIEATTKKLGRPRRSFSNLQISEMTRLLTLGWGRKATCDHLKLSYKTFLRMIREDKRLARALRQAEASRIESCELTLFRLAIGSHNAALSMRAAQAYLGRRDKQAEAQRGRERDRLKRAEQASQKAE